MKFTDAINYATKIAMREDPKIICFGLGVDDPKRIFGTTNDLIEEFGKKRVFDTPTSENAMTGIGVGLALLGFRPLMIHQRLDFFILAMDQLVNSAAKWHYTFGGEDSVPLTIRLIVGRGWGQGPTHCQSLQAWFSHIPGLKVVMPSTPDDARGLLLSSIKDNNPVVFIEHRWVHHQEGVVDESAKLIPLEKANFVKKGKDLTIVAYSWALAEALKADSYLRKNGIECDIIDLRTISPWDKNSVLSSIKKTGRLLVLDTGSYSFSVASEIISEMSINAFNFLKCKPMKLASPDCPVPTSFGLTKAFYFQAEDVVKTVYKMLGIKFSEITLFKEGNELPHDVPGEWFKGPF